VDNMKALMVKMGLIN